VLERYLAVFKALASTPEARQQLLASSADFWKHNIQQQVIVFGKYHFYSILDASDIVTFVFTQLVPSTEAVEAGEATAWTTGHAWDLLKVALEQQFGFAVGSRRKYERFAAEDREARARKAAADGENAMAVGECGLSHTQSTVEGARTGPDEHKQMRSRANKSRRRKETPSGCVASWNPCSSSPWITLSNRWPRSTTRR
jgi:hypothetical protein